MSELNGEGNINSLDKYLEYYGKPDSTGTSGRKRVEEYQIELNAAWNDILRQYPEGAMTDFQNFLESQLKELMNKVDNPAYQVDYSVLEGRK